MAEGGDLGGDVGCLRAGAFGTGGTDEDYAEVGSHGEGLVVVKEGEDLAGRGGGGYVVVLGDEAEEEIADAPAGEEGLVAGVAQAAGDGEGGMVVRSSSLHR